MNLADLTLMLANTAIGLEEYNVTAYSIPTKTITCDMLEGQTGTYGGGTLWYYDIYDRCHATVIERQTGNKIVVRDAPIDAPANVFITPANPFNYQKLAGAVNQVLAIYPIMAIDYSIEVIDTHSTYTLPAGVNDVRRVEYPEGEGYTISHYWRVIGNDLEFYNVPPAAIANNSLTSVVIIPGLAPVPDDGNDPTPTNRTLKISYVKLHGRVPLPDGVVSDQLNIEYVFYISYLNLYRQQLTARHKDNSIAGDIFNEGKMYEQILRDRHANKLNLLVKDFTYAAV